MFASSPPVAQKVADGEVDGGGGRRPRNRRRRSLTYGMARCGAVRCGWAACWNSKINKNAIRHTQR